MSNNIVITDSVKFKEIIDNFRNTTNKIDELFKKENDNLKSISGEIDTWRGDLQEATYKKYNELSSNYDTIIDSLNELAGFLDKSLELYENFENSTNVNINDLANELNVNSQAKITNQNLEEDK